MLFLFSRCTHYLVSLSAFFYEVMIFLVFPPTSWVSSTSFSVWLEGKKDFCGVCVGVLFVGDFFMGSGREEEGRGGEGGGLGVVVVVGWKWGRW